jgi:hypothetical protein
MASIYKRGRLWWVHYLIGGKSVSRSLRTANERVALEKKKRLEALEVTGQLPKPSSTPVDDFLQSFCEFLCRTRTRKSAKNDISYLRMFFGVRCAALQPGSTVNHRFRDGETPITEANPKSYGRLVPARLLEELSTETISGYIRERIMEDHIAPKTANRTRGVLHRMFSYAIEHRGYVCPDHRYHNPAEGVRRAQEGAPVIIWLTTEQISEQLRVFRDSPTREALVATLIYADLRREEALWLTVKDLFVIWVFAWGIAANVFCVVAAVEHLAVYRQFITARRRLQWESWLEARLPIHCVYFPWKWGLVAIGVAVLFLRHPLLNQARPVK